MNAFVLTGSLDNVYAASIIAVAAARGIPCFIDASTTFDFGLVDSGATAYLQLSFASFCDVDDDPAAMARRFLARTGAAGVVVTNAEHGAWGILRGDLRVLHAPAISGIDPIRLLGSGDAHLAGFIPAFLDAPKGVRLERGLSVGRLVAARHVADLKPGNWVDLSRFENQLQELPSLRAVA